MPHWIRSTLEHCVVGPHFFSCHKYKIMLADITLGMEMTCRDGVWWLTPVIPTPWEPEAGRSLKLRSSRPAGATQQNPHLYNKYRNQLGMVMWIVPVVPATQEVETGECLNLGGGGCSVQRSYHCTLAWAKRETPSLKKKSLLQKTTLHVYRALV